MSNVKVSGTLIEGVGDDLIGLFVLILTAVISLAYTYYKCFRPQVDSEVHAESEILAGDVREQRRNDRTNQVADDATNATSSASNNGARLRVQGEVRCPVCLDEVHFSVQTNCGHIFCGECMVTWWQSGRWTGAAKCPVCRQQITVLLQSFSDDERRMNSTEKTALVENIHRYNRRFSGQPLSEYLRDLPTILRHCLTDFFSIGGLMWMFRIRILVCFLVGVLYLISPLDIIPEAVFGFFGLLDDFFIVLLLAIYISIIYRRFIVQRAQEAPGHNQ